MILGIVLQMDSLIPPTSSRAAFNIPQNGDWGHIPTVSLITNPVFIYFQYYPDPDGITNNRLIRQPRCIVCVFIPR